MAAAARQAIMRPAHAIMGNNLPGHHDHSNDPAPSRKTQDGNRNGKAPEALEPEESKERESIAQSNASSNILPPKEIAQDPKHKELGKSSSALSIRDFELVKTLGTGMSDQLLRSSQPTMILFQELLPGSGYLDYPGPAMKRRRKRHTL